MVEKHSYEGDARNFRQLKEPDDLKLYKHYRSYKEILADELNEEKNGKVEPRKELNEWNFLISTLKEIKKGQQPNSNERSRFTKAWLDYAIKLPQHERLFQLLVNPAEKTEEIENLIVELRNIWTTALYRAGLAQPVHTALKPEDLPKTVRRIKKQNPGFKNLIFSGEKQDLLNLKLYHFAPKQFTDSILKQGIIPGFICGQTERKYVYADANKPKFGWIDQKALIYERGGIEHNDFNLFAIDYIQLKFRVTCGLNICRNREKRMKNYIIAMGQLLFHQNAYRLLSNSTTNALLLAMISKLLNTQKFF